MLSLPGSSTRRAPGTWSRDELGVAAVDPVVALAAQ